MTRFRRSSSKYARTPTTVEGWHPGATRSARTGKRITVTPGDPGAAILVEPKTWRRERPTNETRRSSDLTPEEQANVRRALHVLRRRLGGYRELARALRADVHTVHEYGQTRGRPSAGIVVRPARLAGVPLDDVLSGAWPKAGACPALRALGRYLLCHFDDLAGSTPRLTGHDANTCAPRFN